MVRFGDFELDLRTGELQKADIRLNLPDQPINALIALLEQPGQLVTRDTLLQRLWSGDTFVDFEHGLNAAVKRLRDVLGDSADAPRFTETMPRRGYRFIAPVPVVNGGADVLTAPESSAVGTDLDDVVALPLFAKESPPRRLRRVGAFTAAAGLVIGPRVVRHARELPPPVVTKYTQLTTDGENKDGMSDGLRPCFVQHVNN